MPGGSWAEGVGWGKGTFGLEETGTPLLPSQVGGQEVDIIYGLSFPRSLNTGTPCCFSASPLPVALRNLSSFEGSGFLIDSKQHPLAMRASMRHEGGE